MIEENIYYNYMKDVILQGGGKKIIDVDQIIFFFMESKKDLEYLNLDTKSKKNFTENGFPSMYVSMISNTDGDQFDMVFPANNPNATGDNPFKKIIDDYKKNKISFNDHTKILDSFVDIFITRYLKNGIFRKTDIKINMLKRTKLSFANALAFTDKDKKKYFSRFNKKNNSEIENKTIKL